MLSEAQSRLINFSLPYNIFIRSDIQETFFSPFPENMATALHTAGAPEICIDRSGLGRREKLYCPDFNVS